jgi:hypothetical protein
MKLNGYHWIVLGALLVASPAAAYAPRQDAIWARQSTVPITLNGVLDEAAWATAESVLVVYGTSAGVPGSGWKIEAGFTPTNPTNATLKFLVRNNQLYLGATVRDKSIGGHSTFNRWDGFLMAIKDHLSPDFPKPPVEYFYSWWYPLSPDPQPVGQMPIFRGRYGVTAPADTTAPDDTTRTAANIAAWDAKIVVNGQTNTDAVADVGYTVEMRFDLGVLGYDTTRPEGDIVEWNISIYDCDCFWPLAPNCAGGSNFSVNRTWYQSPWGNAYWYDEVHIFTKPGVTSTSGAVPPIPPEMDVPEIPGAAPVVNGVLNEAIWNQVLSQFDIRYGDNELRQTYPGVGPYRSGQFQPTVNGGQADVLDPGDATVTALVKGDWLYLGFDVRDQAVQYHADFDRWDGAIVTLTDRTALGPDNERLTRRLSFQVGPTGQAVAQDYLLTMVGNGTAQLAMTLKAGTTVDTTADINPDTGYNVELALNLTALGYPTGLGDRILWFGVNLLDGDSFSNYTDSYSTRTWWFREYQGQCCPVWAHIIPVSATGVPDGAPPPPPLDHLLGAFPNPSGHPRINWTQSVPGLASVSVFDVSGRLVQNRDLGRLEAGDQRLEMDLTGQSSGLYLYRVDIRDPLSGTVRTSLPGRLVFTK